MTLWTDWTQTDPHYFYLRGALTGAVIMLMITLAFTWIRNKVKG